MVNPSDVELQIYVPIPWSQNGMFQLKLLNREDIFFHRECTFEMELLK